ncbi:S53 family peptidase [Streptomyces sp. 4503]|uniref:S53 family peptidase n=1 Tax=Streptomyces niphimycinicus TaxID=2842201 RepID=A0ABS6CAI2_9ACTN|nr:S53 family peptidase [Streptomyces niphimycinicus]MBU3863878.1 S53 family peptidase [Streptomyces niphimycinicus]
MTHPRSRRRRSRRRTTLVIAPLVAISLGGIAAPALAALGDADAPAVRRVPGGFPEADITHAFGSAKIGGRVDPGKEVEFRVYLAGRDKDGLERYARQVSDPRDTAHYKKYLTAAQARERFGVDDAQVKRVRDWLSGAGLKPGSPTAHYLPVSGPAQKVEKALGTVLKDVRNGREKPVHVPTAVTPVTVPNAVAPSVLAVGGLAPVAFQGDAFEDDPSAHARARAHAPAQASRVPGADPVRRPVRAVGSGSGDHNCSAWFGEKPATVVKPYGQTFSWKMCGGYTPRQMRKAYGLDTISATGKGQTVAVILNGARKNAAADLDAWARHEGVAPLRAGQYKEHLPNPPARETPDKELEQILDLESVRAMAPDADLVYVAASKASPTPGPMFDATAKVVDGRLADVVSNSWYLGVESQMSGDVTASMHHLFALGAVEGIGFTFASGDEGNSTGPRGDIPHDRPAVEYPASDPMVTSVGGTSLILDRNGRYRYETGWGNTVSTYHTKTGKWEPKPPGIHDGGSGGGTSELFHRPSYQDATTPAGGRSVPDISADADPQTSMKLGYVNTSDAPGRYEPDGAGGTSASAPLMAGMLAVLNQRNHGPAGFANPYLYSLHGGPELHDVTDTPLGPGKKIGELSADLPEVYLHTFGHDLGLSATRGYDHVTGLGSPTSALFSGARRR